MSHTGLDACLGLVADRRRRRLIQQLRRSATGETTIDDLVDQLHGSEQVAAEGWPRDRMELATQLHHTHLPKLSDFGVVNYDPGRGTVHYQPVEHVEAVLDSLPGEVAATNS
jgi:hypothetical protein